jgi:DNA-binding IclR family transcriptional regulator
MLNPAPEKSPEDLSLRARAEFREMPGMCLTTAQAARLWQLSPAKAEELLSALVQTGFLVRRDGQRYRLPSSVSIGSFRK